jgi:hypothetical protein
VSAGLPGLGLGGLFFIFSALLAPFPELWKTLRGRSDLGSWKKIGRQLVQALAMVAAIDLTLRLTYVALSVAGIGDPPAADDATVLPLNLIGITTGLLVLVLCGAKLAELAMRARGGGLPRVPEVLPRVAPLRAGAFAAVAAITWVALLATGASRLSPLERPPREQIASRPEQDAGAVPLQGAVEPRPQGQGGPSSIATEATGGGRGGAAGTPNGVAAPDSGEGAAGIAPSPNSATAKAPPSPPATSAPIAIPEPTSSPGPPPKTAAGPPESAGPPEGVPASEGAGPAAEPPPQAPAKGLRESE